MSTKEIKYLLQNITDLNQNFQKKDYQLSSLDVHSLKHLLEQLHIKLITETGQVQHPVQSKVIPQPKPEIVSPPKPEQSYVVKSGNSTDSSSIDQMNDELDEVFSPQPVKPVMSDNVNRHSFLLGINERIMFAKELFDDDVNAMQESLQKLKSFETKEEALQYYENTFAPFLVDEGKDEDIISEFQQVLHRIYS